MDQNFQSGAVFNPLQKRSLLVGCLDIHRRMAELEALLSQAEPRTRFSRYAADLAPVEQQVLRDYFARIRDAMGDLLQAYDIPLDHERLSLRWTAATSLAFLQVAAAEMGPDKLRGYGELTAEGSWAALRMQQELERLIEQAARTLRPESGGDLAERLARLETSVPNLVPTLTTIEEVVTRHGLVEFRPQLELLLRRLENARLEIAVFGRVNSGKSSLLNQVAGQGVLPVGVTPVTAVPTRLTWGPRTTVQVDFLDAASREIPLGEVAEYASEARNPGNRRHVTRIEIALPASRLREGVVLVDTPGIGSLARSGGRETFAYLPQCDLAVVLVNAGSTLHDEDLALLHLLREAATPVQILLSKADLLSADDRARLLEYVEQQIENALGVNLPVFPVSVVGPHEALWQEWFNREIVPLCHKHHDLRLASLRRKLARLRDAVLATLELLSRRQDHHLPADVPDRMRALLQTGDDLLREAQFRVRQWRDHVDRQPDFVLRRAAEVLVRANPSNTDRRVLLQQTVQSGLHEQAQSGVEFADGLRRRLALVLQELQSFAPEAGLDPAGVERLTPTGLPPPEWGGPVERPVPRPPWWSFGSLRIGRSAVLRRLRKSFRADVGNALLDYTRSVEIWLRDYVARLTSLYEAQVEVVRQRLRRRRDGFATGETVAATELVEDIRRLREIDGSDRERDAARPHSSANADAGEGNGQPPSVATGRMTCPDC